MYNRKETKAVFNETEGRFVTTHLFVGVLLFLFSFLNFCFVLISFVGSYVFGVY